MAHPKKYPLVVAQYDLRSHPRRTEHWNVAILESRERAHIYELAGDTDTFHYEYKVVSNFARSANFRGGCYVGSITEDKVAWLNEKLREVNIVLHNPDFDAQTWVINAVRHLKGEEGVVIEEVRERVIRAELELEKDRWDAVEDTIEDRLFHKPRREMGPVVIHSANPKISEEQEEEGKVDGCDDVPEQTETETGTGEGSDGGKAASETHEK